MIKLQKPSGHLQNYISNSAGHTTHLSSNPATLSAYNGKFPALGHSLSGRKTCPLETDDHALPCLTGSSLGHSLRVLTLQRYDVVSRWSDSIIGSDPQFNHELPHSSPHPVRAFVFWTGCWTVLFLPKAQSTRVCRALPFFLKYRHRLIQIGRKTKMSDERSFDEFVISQTWLLVAPNSSTLINTNQHGHLHVITQNCTKAYEIA